ncbi:hypothetical protein Tco_0974769 [Tanacetum coccineum]|uniref:Uncharacterized protein n=1 Tax=Tanacetum coccineum TaxID=301880 RepID=A0ABQ5EDL8_9ASTR
MVVENIVDATVVVKNIAVVMTVVKKIVVAYFLDSCNFGSRIVDFDDTPIVSDKLDRGVTFAFQKGDTVATNLSFGNLGSGGGVVAKAVAKPRRLWRSHVGCGEPPPPPYSFL